MASRTLDGSLGVAIISQLGEGANHRPDPEWTFLLGAQGDIFIGLQHFGYLPLLSRPAHIVYFFHDVHGVGAITKDVLRKRTDDYNRWVESFARHHNIPLEWAEKGVRKEDYTRPALRRMERQKRFGVYFILKSMEVGTSFRSAAPKYPTDDPDYRILRRQRCRFTHYYFYIRDKTLGPLALGVASFLPFHTTYYLNGHHFIERELERRGVRYRKNDNSFLGCGDPDELQAAAYRRADASIQHLVEVLAA